MPCDAYSRRKERPEAGREQRRRLLTRGERAVAWSLAAAPSLLVLGGIALHVWSSAAAHDVGIALLTSLCF